MPVHEHVQPVQEEAIAGRRPEAFPSKRFVVFIRGMTGGGRANSLLRDTLHDMFGDKALVYSSLSTPETIRHPDRSLDLYRGRAEEILGRAGDQPLTLFGHSLGAVECIDQAHALMKHPRYPMGQPLDMVLVSQPGAGLRGRQVTEVIGRVWQMGRSVVRNEQDTVYPLPHGGGLATAHEADIAVADTEAFREARRHRFADEWLPSLVPDKTERDQILAALRRIDQNLAAGVDRKRNLAKREALLAPLIHALLRGDHLDEETHRQFLEQYREQPEQLRRDLFRVAGDYASALLYLARDGMRIWRGVDRSMAALVSAAKKKGIPVRFTYVLLGKDTVMKPGDMETVRGTLADQASVDHMCRTVYLETFAHSTLGYDGEAVRLIVDSAMA